MKHLLIISLLAFAAADVLPAEHYKFLFPDIKNKKVQPPFSTEFFNKLNKDDETAMRTVIIDLADPPTPKAVEFHRAINFTVQGAVSDVQRRVYKNVKLSFSSMEPLKSKPNGNCNLSIEVKVGSAIVTPGRRVLKYTSLGNAHTVTLSKIGHKHPLTIRNAFNDSILMDDFWVHLKIKSSNSKSVCPHKFYVTLEDPDNRKKEFPSH